MADAIGFISVLGLVGLILAFRYFSNVRKLEAMVKLAELGGNADSEIMKILGDARGNYKTDIRKGLLWLAIGIPLATSFLIEEGIVGLILGSIPILIGVVFLVSAKYRLREN